MQDLGLLSLESDVNHNIYSPVQKDQTFISNEWLKKKGGGGEGPYICCLPQHKTKLLFCFKLEKYKNQKNIFPSDNSAPLKKWNKWLSPKTSSLQPGEILWGGEEKWSSA